MGYYSNLSVALQQKNADWMDHSCPIEDTLETRLAILQEQLLELDSIRPHNRMDLMYDRYFSSEYYTDEYGPKETVQDLLAKIQNVKLQLIERLLIQWKHEAGLRVIEETGATPDGQMTIISVFVPSLALTASKSYD